MARGEMARKTPIASDAWRVHLSNPPGVVPSLLPARSKSREDLQHALGIFSET
jgi:hypothetical protein